MIKSKRILLLIMFICCMIFGINEGQLTVMADVTASQAYVNAMSPGWNLGNTFEAVDTWSDRSYPGFVEPIETAWGNIPTTKELLASLKAQGFNSIRMPFTCYTRIGDAPDYKIMDAYIDRYAEVVQWAVDAGLYVIVDMHGDAWSWGTGIGTDDGTLMNKYKVLWKAVADKFKDYPEQVCFEALNEPAFNGTKAEQIKINNEVNKAFYDVVRNSGGKNATRMLLLPLLSTSAEEEECRGLAEGVAKLNDPNIMVTFHYYGYWPFSANVAGTTTYTSEVKKGIEDAIDIMDKYFIRNGIGVIAGEYGVLSEPGVVDHGEYLKYMEYLTWYGQQHNINMMVWDAGQLINRSSLTWKVDDIYDVIMSSANSIRSSSTECDSIFVKNSTRSSDASMKVNLNGNTLVSISDESKTLIEGVDYTCENGVLTFKGSYINSVIDGSYGVNEKLVLKFSQGADWKISVIYRNTPISSNASGTSTSLKIPVNFNGSILSTMEAADISGRGVGPNNWTTYKEYKQTFEPNYTDNTIEIKEAFFKECSDGVINLTFHWKDGLTTKYTLNKSGSTVTGVSGNETMESEKVVISDEVILGDVNNDGKVNIKDYVKLQKYILNNSIEINKDNSDVNNDGKINITDILLLKKIIIG